MILKNREAAVVATFVFLRFICLAINNPKLNGLWKTLRFIVLLSKVIQNSAFGVEFEKEDYMLEMNDYIRVNKEKMKHWIDRVSIEAEDEDEEEDKEEGDDEDEEEEIEGDYEEKEEEGEVEGGDEEEEGPF